jgi:ribosomal protein S18 acetylase RimI-like enzyme
MNVRRPGVEDAAAVTELIRAYDEAYGYPPDTDASDLLSEWEEVELDRDAWLFEVDGRLAGYGCVYGRRTVHLDIDGYVHPAFAGGGIGSRIRELGEARVRERGVACVHNATLHADVRGRELFESRGYAFVRAFFRMAIELDAQPPPAVVPEGLRLAPLTEGDDPAVHAALQEAFADHWDHEPQEFEAWRRRRADSDRSSWLGVWDGDELAGFSVNDLGRFGGGWISTLGTRRPWRGRGVATALLLASFAEFHRRGERTVQLNVDAANPTGAVRVYERAGMRVAARADIYEKALA